MSSSSLVRDMCFGHNRCPALTVLTKLLLDRWLYCSSFRWDCANRPSVANVHHSKSQKCFLDSYHDIYMHIATIIKASSTSDGDMNYQSMATHSKRGIHTPPWECTDRA